MLGMKIFTYFKGELVGDDEFGNKYYRQKNSPESVKEKRWVMYAGEEEASKVPAEWHCWLHHTFETPASVSQIKRYPWQKTHLPNLTGTSLAYHPPGHVMGKNARDPSTGDYEPWVPS